jgi:hypothetical protein
VDEFAVHPHGTTLRVDQHDGLGRALEKFVDTFR